MNQTLVTVVILVIAALVILWLFTSLGNADGQCVGPKPDPVGGIVTTTETNGLVAISWDPSENASKYKLYVNNCPPPVTSGRNATSKTIFTKNAKAGKHKVGACGGDCCPSDASTCTACVSQTNYKAIFETTDTSIVIETCEPCLCFMIVPYNSCNQAGPCNEINYVNVQCVVDTVDAWISNNDCNGTTIQWNPPRCADTIIVLVNDDEVIRVAASDRSVTIAQVPDNLEIDVQAESACGLGQVVVVRPAPVTAGTKKDNQSKFEDWKKAQSKVSAKKPKRRQPHPRAIQPHKSITVKDYKIQSGEVRITHA